MHDLFPDLARASGNGGSKVPDNDDDDRFAAAGLELDPSLHTVEVGLKGGRCFNFFVSAREASRIRSCLLSETNSDFLIIDTPSHRYALNYDAVAFSRLLFDPFVEVPEVEVREGEGMKVWFNDQQEPFEVGIDPDDRRQGDEDDIGNLQGLFFDLEQPYSEEKSALFEDEDGEEVILFRSAVALLSVPQEYVRPELLDAQIEGMEEEVAF